MVASPRRDTMTPEERAAWNRGYEYGLFEGRFVTALFCAAIAAIALIAFFVGRWSA
jgi:hypothetical protein